ncbi:hypothetical protein ACEWY4_006446 [Coilia grayii]|uniref:G-protein coupled receptors family 1 profile domain-containing protein n=1 Tax=Coilia grayii TaxID=363190 RepID=A0ABD1KDP9_9TELE
MDYSLPTPMETLESEDYSAATEDYSEFTFCDKSSVREFRKYYEPPLYIIITILGVLGNALVIWIYSFYRTRVKTMTDVYLLNLAVADLMFLLTLPLWASDALNGWTFGSILCKITSACYKINFFSSMLLLTCISVDRYIVIVQTTKAQNSKNKRLLCGKLVCMVVWLLAVLLSAPELIFASTKTDEESSWQYCTLVYSWNNKNNRTKILVLVLQIFMGFCLPLVVMFFCYTCIIHTLMKTRSFEKHKALRVILVVVAVFVLSQLPYNAMLIVEATQAANVTITDCNVSQSFDIATQIMKGLAYTHCCLNPFLYVFIGVRFRRDLLKILQHYGCLSSGSKLSKLYGTPIRASAMSDTDTTQALSL